MAAGVPAVSFDCASGPREIVEHDVNGLLVAPESIGGLAAALLRVASDDELRHRLGEGALRSSRQYDAARLAERWVGIFADARAVRGGRDRLAARAEAKPPRRSGHAGDRRHDRRHTRPGPSRRPRVVRGRGARAAPTSGWSCPPTSSRSRRWSCRCRRATASSPRSAGPGAPAYLSLRDPAVHGWHLRRGTVAELATDLRRGRTSFLSVEPWPEGMLARGCTVDVEFWETALDGDLIAPRRNRYTERIAAGTLPGATVEAEVDGVSVRTLPLMAEPTVGECRFPVDVVYTWVDGSDPAWDAAREKRLAGITGTPTTRESSGRARYLAHDELRHSLRSLHLFAPWVRRIHLVTAGQVPDWLDTEHPQIELVDHSAILPSDALPTFNSHAIETALHRIEGLAEHFVYLNDDFFLGRPVRPELFFNGAGLPQVVFSPTTIGLSDSPGAPPYLKAAWNNRSLLREAFGATTTNNMARTGPTPTGRLDAWRDRGALPRGGRRDRSITVPLGHRRLDAQLAGPALRTARRRRRSSARATWRSSTSPTATSTGSWRRCSSGDRTSSASATTTTTRSRRSSSTHCSPTSTPSTSRSRRRGSVLRKPRPDPSPHVGLAGLRVVHRDRHGPVVQPDVVGAECGQSDVGRRVRHQPVHRLPGAFGEIAEVGRYARAPPTSPGLDAARCRRSRRPRAGPAAPTGRLQLLTREGQRDAPVGHQVGVADERAWRRDASPARCRRPRRTTRRRWRSRGVGGSPRSRPRGTPSRATPRPRPGGAACERARPWPVVAVARRHRSATQNARGSLTTSRSSWPRSQAQSSSWACADAATSCISPNASGRASTVRTGAMLSSRLWKSTTHRDSKKPRGLVSSAGTPGPAR